MMIVGIDVSKDKLDIKILPTGGYEKSLMVFLIKEGLPYHRAHPNRVYHFAKGKGCFAKTDRIDAAILARYGEQEEIKAEEAPRIDSIEIQELSARKKQVKEMITREKNRLHAVYVNHQIGRSIKRSIKQQEKELQLINEQIEKMIQENEKYQEKRELLQTIVGVGKEVATLMVTDMPELGKLTREQISKLVGVAPQTKESGKKASYRSIGQGRGQVRKALYMSALVAMRHNKRLKPMYDRLVQKGKKPKVALVALMRKLIITMNAMVRDNRPWVQQLNLT